MKNGKLVLWSIVLFGILVSIAYYLLSKQAETEHINSEVKALGDVNFYAINQELSKQLLIMQSLKNYFEASNFVSRDEFNVFVEPFIKQFPSIKALEWIPLVKNADRLKFELRHRSKLLPDFQITERKTQGEMVRRSTNDEYFPVTYLEPLKGNEKALGFDLESNVSRAKTLKKSRTTGKMIVTSRINLVQEKGTSYGILLVNPIFKAEGSQVKEFEGFVTGVLKIGDMVLNTRYENNLVTNKIRIKLIDITDTKMSDELFSELNFDVLKAPYLYKKELVMADRVWQVQGVPTPEYIDSLQSNKPIYGTLLGLALTALIYILIHTLLNKTEEINQQVVQRTQELDESSKRLDTVIDNIEDGIITIGQKGIITLFNPAAERIFQYKAIEVIGQNVSMLVPAPHSSKHDLYIANYLESGIAKIIGKGREVEGLKKDGSTFPMRLAIGEMKFENEYAFVGIVIDITEQKKNEKDLIIAKETAEASNRLKSDFLNTMSHELRTPLTVILGNIDELTSIEDLPDTDEIVDIAKDCRDAGNHLMRLINDLLDISKIEAGKMNLTLENTTLSTIINDSVQIISRLAESKNLAIKTDINDIDIKVDFFRIKQVLLNLLSNAIKFTDRGEIQILSETSENELFIHVNDTGQGMDADSLQFVFEPFRQVDNTSKRKVGGTGLGLAISKKLLELHGGKISVKSQLNKGSTFTICLPITPQIKSNENTISG
jgi:PAS domain S-box-containing protein